MDVAAYSKAPALLLSPVLLKVCVIMDGLMGRSVMGGGRWPLSFSQLSGIMVENRDVTEGREACVKTRIVSRCGNASI